MKSHEILDGQRVKPPKFGWRIITYWSREWRCWVAMAHDEHDDQHGDAGYGPSKTAAIADLKYQNPELWDENK